MGKEKKTVTETSELSESSTEEGSDFFQPQPKDILPDDIKNFTLKQGDCCAGDEIDYDSTTQASDNEQSADFFDDGNKRRSSKKMNNDPEGSMKKKIIAFIMMFPMIVTAFTMMGDIASKFNIDKFGMQVTATLGGAGIALFVLSRVPQLRDAVKFVLCFAWILLLLPTYQVYTCSPVELPNSMVGTWFKLKTTQHDFLEKTYVTSECFTSLKLQSPYMLSAVSTKVSLVMKISKLINLDEDENQEGGSGGGGGGTKYFLAVSKRSVKKKFHKLYLIIEAADIPADMLARSLKLPKNEKDKHLLVVKGSIHNLEDEMLPMKKELEKLQYLVRPIKLKVASVSYRDRYAKFKPTHDESLY